MTASDPPPPTETVQLLRRWHEGDRGALDSLLERDLDWVTAFVSRRLGGLLRQKGETHDFVQMAMLEVLQYGPRFRIADKGKFRALMGRIVENMLRDQNDWYRARRRAADKERPLPSDSIVEIDPPVSDVTQPPDAAQRNEREAWIRLALELLEPEDRKVILLKQWDDKTFVEIGEEMGLTSDAVRMRFNRALAKLARQVEALQRGIVEEREADGG